MEIALQLGFNLTIVITIVKLAFENELEYCNFDFSSFIGYQFSTLCEILVRFGSVTPEFKT